MRLINFLTSLAYCSTVSFTFWIFIDSSNLHWFISAVVLKVAKNEDSNDTRFLSFQCVIGFCPSCVSLNHSPAAPCKYPATTWSLYSLVYWFILADLLNSSNHSIGSRFPPPNDGILASFLIRKASCNPFIKALVPFSSVLRLIPLVTFLFVTVAIVS